MKTYQVVMSIGWLSALMLTGCGSDSQKAAVHKPAGSSPSAVTTFPVQSARRVTLIHLPGDLKAYDEADLFAKVNAYVKMLYVDRGAVVAKGQRLAQLEAPELTSQLVKAKAQWLAARANFITAKTNYDRLDRTSQADAGTISLNDLDRARGAMQASEATMQAAQSEVQAAQELNQYLTVSAPFAGVITTRNVSVGALVGAGGGNGGKPLFQLENGKRLRLVVAIPEKYAGQLLTPRTKVPFTVQAFPGQVFTGVFQRKADALLNNLRAELIEMDVNNADGRLKSGMYADIQFAMQPPAASLAVPVTSVINRSEQPHVVRVSAGRAEWIPVSRGRLLSKDSVEVFGPLQSGDQLVVQPTDGVKDGEPVRMNEKKPPEKQLAASQQH